MKIIKQEWLVTPAQYVAERRQVFPSVDSLRWFERQHRDELIAKGAVLMPAGRKLLNPTVFDAAVIEIGQKLAAGRAARAA